jgi:hypothetical protein
MIGSTLRAKASAAARDAALGSSLRQVRAIAEQHALGLLRGQCRLGAFADQRPLLFRQRRVEVEQERVGVRSQLGHDERHLLRHQVGDKGHVAR